LFGARRPAWVETHPFVRFAISNAPVMHASRVFCFAALVFECQDDGHK
jgi:hypothetical protein